MLLVSYSSYSYSETVNGTTGNAADIGYNWVMQNILPQQAGLEVTGIFYQYTAVKDPNSDMVVYVQNEDAQNQGQYIFREVDDWSQKPGRTIRKLLPQPNVLIDRWGDGSIEVEGEGTVEDALVAYDYRYDPCFDPQSDPSCPDYVQPIPDIPEVDLTALYEQEDRFIQESEDNKKVDKDEEEEKERDRKKAVLQKKRERLEIALGGINSELLTENAQEKHSQLMALSIIPTTYINASIDGGSYEEPFVLKDKNLPDNKSGRRAGLMQQLLHEQMVEQQYVQNNNNKGEQ